MVEIDEHSAAFLAGGDEGERNRLGHHGVAKDTRVRAVRQVPDGRLIGLALERADRRLRW